MAGDWIKVEIGTASKTEVLRMASMLNMSRQECMGFLCDYWSWLDANTRTDFVPNLSRQCLDDVLHCAGFAAALESVGWVKWSGDEWGMTVINYDHHNGSSAKTRASEQRKKREQRRDTTGTREEKRREEITTKSNTTTTTRATAAAPPGVRQEVWDKWKRAKGRKLTPDAVALQSKQLVEWAAAGDDPNKIIEQSIAAGWAGLFPLRKQGGNVTAKAAVSADIWKRESANELPSVVDITGESERVA